MIKAVYAIKPDIVKILLAAGANKNARDKDGMTALDIADLMGYKEIKKLLE